MMPIGLPSLSHLVHEGHLGLRQAVDPQRRVRAGQVVLVAGGEERGVVQERWSRRRR